ncbi:MAG: arsenate reductase ArsC [Ferrimicrobium sp.]
MCIQNAGRSQMAAAFARAGVDPSISIYSAGSAPAQEIHPEVILVMDEIGFDLSGLRPHSLMEVTPNGADVVVTMGCGDACPFVPGQRRFDWHIPDPAGQEIAVIREIRDLLRSQVNGLLLELGLCSGV